MGLGLAVGGGGYIGDMFELRSLALLRTPVHFGFHGGRKHSSGTSELIGDGLAFENYHILPLLLP